MNQSHDNDDKAAGIANAVKAAMLVCVLGFIALIADRAMFTPSEPSAPGMTTLLMPLVAGPLSRDGRFDAIAPSAMSSASASADRPAVAPAATQYPEPAGDAVRDQDGHPPSF